MNSKPKDSLENIIDISPILSPEIAVWPGDTPLSRRIICDISAGSNIDLSTLTSTVHVGAHADAPRHFHVSGKTIEAVALDAYLGNCHVVSVVKKELITLEDCERIYKKGMKRILFRTLSFPNPNHFNTDFAAFSAEAMEFLGRNGVVLVGIDTPSVDAFDSKDLKAHQMLLKYSIANVEGLVLDHVSDGEYEFIGLPLKLQGFDASPIRAVLRRLVA